MITGEFLAATSTPVDQMLFALHGDQLKALRAHLCRKSSCKIGDCNCKRFARSRQGQTAGQRLEAERPRGPGDGRPQWHPGVD